MKNPIFLFTTFVLFATITSCKDDEDVQLLANSNVEMGSTMPDNWGANNAGGKFAVEWTEEAFYSPSRSLKLSTPVSDPVDIAYWAQTIKDNIPVREAVTLRVKIKGELTGDGVSISIRADDTADAAAPGEQFVSTQVTTPITGTFDWKDYSVKLEKVDKGIKSLTIFLVYLPNTTGDVYFDDITLTY